MLVVEEGETAKPALKQATELLKNTNLLGTVLNKGDHRGKYYDY